LDCRERVFTAIEHREPDKVPKGELEIVPEMVRRLLGGRVEDRFEGLRACVEMLHMDIVNTYTGWPKPEQVGVDEEGRVIEEDIFGVRSVHGDITDANTPPITEPEQMWTFEFPEADVFDTSWTARWAKETEYFISGQTGGPFGTLEMLLGWENAMIFSKTDLPAMKDLARRAARLFAEIGRKSAESGADMVVVAEDIAFNTGTFFSPDTLREVVFPALKEEVREIKKSGVPVMMHSDGNLNGVMDDIVDCGFDALQSLQPSAGMDIAEIKRKYGDKLCLMGNLDLNWLMPYGTPEDVRNAVREVIRAAAPGGGFILSTCNVLTRDIPAENAIAMYDEAERFGVYPLDGAEEG